MVIDGHNQSVSNRLTIKKKYQRWWNKSHDCPLLWLFPSGSAAADHLPPSHHISCLLSFYTNYFHVLYQDIYKNILWCLPLFFFFHSNSISSIICLIRKYIHCFNTSPNHLHVTSLHSSTLTLPLTCSFLIQSIDQSQHFHLLQLRPRILSIRHSHCL